jgi:hypothetical protein
MKIWSDVLTDHDLWQAQQAASQVSNAEGKGNVGFERMRALKAPRVRRAGWDVLLYRIGSRRHFNTGTYGAGEDGAASWDDYGWFIAVLFERDPGARIAHYNGREAFHAATRNKFSDMSGWGERGKARRDEHGTAVSDIATDGACGRSWNDALGTTLTPAPAARCPYEYEHEAMGVSA